MLSIAIVPAAGRSVRMGQAKLLLPWNGGTLIERVLGSWRASRVSHVIVVVHPDDEQLAAICRKCGAQPVIAHAPPPDMKASVQIGLDFAGEQFAPVPEDCWLVAPADMPGLAAETIDRLLLAYERGGPRIIVPEHRGRRGHPVLFPWSLAAEVSRLGADEGIKELFHRHSVETMDWPDASVLEDLDTPADYERLRTQYDAP